jgi:ribulose-phosphate 3-epimerase
MTTLAEKVKLPAIAPSILTADFGRLREQIQEAEEAGVDLIHLDVMDGHFVPNISFGPLIVSAIRSATSLPLDVHLMIEKPERYLDAFVDAGADMVSLHIEATPHAHRAIQQIRNRDVAAGIALNPATPLGEIEELLPIVDLVLLMSVNPGYGGQSFIPESVDKIARLKALLDRLDCDPPAIEVDGGIKPETIRRAYDAGAGVFVCGSSVFNDSEPVAAAVSKLRSYLA